MAPATDLPVSNTSFIVGLRPLLKTPQFYWFLGHASAIFFTILCSLFSLFRSPLAPTPLKYYNYSLNCIIFTYLIVLRQSYKSRPILTLLAQYPTLLKDDNVQYLSLALLFRLSSKFPGPIQGGLYPFVIFAIFHSINYIKSYLLPILPLDINMKNYYSNLITTIITNYNEQSLYVAANTEVVLIIQVIFTLIKLFLLFGWLRSNPIKTLKNLAVSIGIIIFIKFRYDQSKFTKAIINSYDLKINQILYSSPYIPESFRTIYQVIKKFIITYIGPIRVPIQRNIRKND
ncbi:hypothetical protein PACTADRAFT_55181 [Pachysolen tannophilus NRRL Y-2460]|uniref:Uncharacterized protein n=1 Tax=Pachysolen tannophilus NRRL Y-2460 TaxID=669874 RepID=A0A1E4TZ22_PACTA|nr:hypothetical protein PACTADRAFT_55181 [Pachysolen tannophilus NRRL Y-2460]